MSATGRGAWLKVAVQARDDGHVLTFSRPRTGKELPPIHVRAGKLAAARGEMTRLLSWLAGKMTEQEQWQASQVDPILRDFYDQAFQLGAGAMANGSDDMREIRDFLRSPPGWWRRGREHAPVVEVEGEDHDFPFELLPVFDHDPIEPIRDAHAVLLLVRRFLGFTCAVRRQGRMRVPPGWNLEGAKLPISFLRHANLDGAQREARFFDSMADHIVVDGPWPVHDIDAELMIAKVAEIMFDGRRRLRLKRAARFTQIHHFACHCEVGEAGDALVLSVDNSSDESFNRHFPLSKLSSRYAQQKPLRGESLPSGRALVFLNACGSALVDPLRLTSFPESFLSERHRGVIGAATAVDDKLAAEFSEAFYRNLLAGRSVGTALVKARCWLAHRFHSPLGALYVLYADPDIRLVPPVARGAIEHPCLDI